MRGLSLTLLLSCCPVALFAADAKDRSGPQAGETIGGFKVRGVLDDERGQEIDLVSNAAGKPLLLAFVHERTRPALGLARHVLQEATSSQSGLVAGLVLLTDDVSGTEEWVLVARQALPRGVTIGVSPDGPLGPPAYNLSQRVQLTIIAAKDNRVVLNRAFTAPTLDDAAEVAKEFITALK